MPRKVQTRETSAPPSPTRVRPLPGPADTDTLLAKFKDYPAIEVITRRFNDPSDPGSLPILLKDEASNACHNSEHQNKLKAGAATCRICHQPARQWHVRYFNLGQEGRHAQMRSKGYIAVEIKDLKESDDVADLFRSKDDTFVRRGDRGQEMLGKMPLELYNEIKRRQKAMRDARAESSTALEQDLAANAGAELGDEAGQSIADGLIKVEYQRRPKTTLAEEAERDS